MLISCLLLDSTSSEQCNGNSSVSLSTRKALENKKIHLFCYGTVCCPRDLGSSEVRKLSLTKLLYENGNEGSQ